MLKCELCTNNATRPLWMSQMVVCDRCLERLLAGDAVVCGRNQWQFTKDRKLRRFEANVLVSSRPPNEPSMIGE